MEWKNVTNLSIKEIEEFTNYQVPELELKLSQLSNVRKFGRDLKCGALIDCFTNIFEFCKESSFSVQHISWVIKLQGMLLENCKQCMSIDENMRHLLHSMNNTSPPCPPNLKDNGLDAKKILNFLMKSFFQHYHLYRFLFTNDQEHVALKKTIEVETIPTKQPFPPPLEEAILESLYEEYLNPKPIEEDVAETQSEETVNETLDDQQKLSPEEDIDALLSSLNPNDLKKLIREIADTKFNSVRAELEGKIMERETALTKTFNKLQAR